MSRPAPVAPVGGAAAVAALRETEDRALVREIVTPEGIPLRFTLARAGDRAAAFAIDVVILFGALFLIGIGLYGAGAREDSGLTGALLLIMFLLRTFYFAVLEVRWQGQTPGKRQVGIRVIDARGGQLETRAILARNLVRELEVWIPFGILFGGGIGLPDAPGWARLLAAAWAFVFLFLPAFNKDRLRVGDMIAGTRVVRQPKIVLLPDLADATAAARSAAPATGAAAGHAFSAEQLAIYGIYELQVLEGVLRLRPGDPAQIEALRTVSEKVRHKLRYEGRVLDDERFLRDFYAAQRAYLEQKMLFGQRRQDKSS